MMEQVVKRNRPNRKQATLADFTRRNQVAPEIQSTDIPKQGVENSGTTQVLKRKALRLGSVIGILPLNSEAVATKRFEVSSSKLSISKHAEKDWYVARHNSWIADCLHTVATVSALWNLIEVPVDVAFQYSQVHKYGGALDIVVDVLIWIYIFSLFGVTVITSNDIELTSISKIFVHRISSKSFWCDLLTSLPYDLIWIGLRLETPQSISDSYPPDVALHVTVQLLRLPKIIRAANILRFVFNVRQASSLTWSLMQMILIYMIVVHFLACGLYFVGMYQVGPDQQTGHVRWVDLMGLSRPDTPILYRYSLSLYWSLIVVTSTGFGDIVAVTIHEKMFMIFCLSCTVTTSALLFSGLFSIIEKMDAQNAAKQAYKEELMTYLELERVDKSIVDSLIDNIELYLKEEFVRSSIIFENTPQLFQNRVHRAVYLEMMSSFAIFQTVSEKCLHELCCIVKIEVAMADDVLSHVGDVQSQLYLITRGSVVVSDPERGTVYGVLGRGCFFGELAILPRDHLSKCKAPAIKTKENCCFLTLPRTAMFKILNEFPEDMLHLEKIALCRARMFHHNSLPTLDQSEIDALFLTNVIAAIAGSDETTNRSKFDSPNTSIQMNTRNDSQFITKRQRTSHRPGMPDYLQKFEHLFNLHDASLTVFFSSQVTAAFTKFERLMEKVRVILTTTVPESNRRRKHWEGLVCIGVLYWVVMAPMDVAFGIYDQTYSAYLRTARWFFDSVFFLDICLSFFFEPSSNRSSLHKSAKTYKEIRASYLKRGFLLDLITTLPYDYIPALDLSVGDHLYPKHLVYVPPIFLFLRLIRLRKLVKWFNNIVVKDLFAMQALRLSKLLIAYYIFLHWSACLVFLIGRSQTEGNNVSGRNPWIIDQGLCFTMTGDTSSPFTDRSNVYFFEKIANSTNFPGSAPPLRRPCARVSDVKTQYITTLYWMTIMFTTVGYGEIVPTTLPEIFCLVFVLFLSSLANVSITGNITNIIASAGGGLRKTQQDVRLKIIDSLNQDDFSKQEIENGTKMLNFMVATNNLLQTRDMLSQIPTHMRKTIMKQIYMPVLESAFMFRDVESEFISLLCCCSRIEVALAKQTIISYNGRSKSMYVISKGTVNIMDSTQTVIYSQLSKSNHFGELNLFYEKSNLFSAVAQEDCVFMVWTQSHFDDALEYYPHYRALFHEVCERRIEKICWIISEKVRCGTLEESVANRCLKEITHLTKNVE